MNTPLTRYLTALRALAAGNDPATHEAAAMWAEYQRLLAVEAGVGELASCGVCKQGPMIYINEKCPEHSETIPRPAIDPSDIEEWCAGRDERRAG